jgi:hypothetical protein
MSNPGVVKTVKGEVPIAGGATTTPGKLYTVFHSSIPNPNGVVKVCPVGQITATAMLTALGYSGGIAAPTNVPLRAAGAHFGVLDDGDDVWGT